jgi:hypothetical protein
MKEYVSPAKWRPACALARRSASARRREAAPAKAGNAAGSPFGQTQGMFFQHYHRESCVSPGRRKVDGMGVSGMF